MKPHEKYKYDEQEDLRNVIDDINESELVLDTAVMDNPKRSKLRNAKSSSGKCGCEYCEASAIHFKDNTMKRSHLTWPPSTMNGRPRTITGIRRIVNSIENEEEDLTANYCKGIKGRSVLLYQPNFNIIHDLPTEHMHAVCLGIVKPLLEYTYKVGKERPRITNRKKCDPKVFNDIIITIQVTSEFPRRCRYLDTTVYKALEYRNALIVFFPIILKNIPIQYKKERQLWLTLVFMIRACLLPNEEYQIVNKATIATACELFYNLFFELFGQRNCTYSVHIVSSHLFKMRGNVPLTERSAFPFESFYSEMKNLFKPGTPSPLKQILKNTYMKRLLEHHVCEKKIVYKEQKQNVTMENNSFIYTWKNNTHELYVICSINNDEFLCKRQGKFEFRSSLLPDYDWKTIGVYRMGPIGSQTYNIKKKEIKGKYINVLDVLITCPSNVLQEK